MRRCLKNNSASARGLDLLGFDEEDYEDDEYERQEELLNEQVGVCHDVLRFVIVLHTLSCAKVAFYAGHHKTIMM